MLSQKRFMTCCNDVSVLTKHSDDRRKQCLAVRSMDMKSHCLGKTIHFAQNKIECQQMMTNHLLSSLSSVHESFWNHTWHKQLIPKDGRKEPHKLNISLFLRFL